jgi:ribosomal protein L34E
MRPSLRTAKKKKVKTPGGSFSWHRVKKTSGDNCAVCHRPLLGSGRSRPHGNMCVPCSRKMVREKVKKYAQEE